MRKFIYPLIILFCIPFMMDNEGCNDPNLSIAAKSEVSKIEAKTKLNERGLTVEQENLLARNTEDNQPGAIKHLYVISPYSGDVLIYSTVIGKVTSSGKRLNPKTATVIGGEYISDQYGFSEVTTNGIRYWTPEVQNDDRTFGSSESYIHWRDVRNVWHQHFLTGEQIIHISSQPLVLNKVIINMEIAK